MDELFNDKWHSPSEIAEALASIDNTSTTAEIGKVQWNYLASNELWFSLGWRNGIEYGVQNAAWKMTFWEIACDEDDKKQVPVALEQGKIEHSFAGKVFSLHRLLEISSDSHPHLSGSNANTDRFPASEQSLSHSENDDSPASAAPPSSSISKKT